MQKGKKMKLTGAGVKDGGQSIWNGTCEVSGTGSHGQDED